MYLNRPLSWILLLPFLVACAAGTGTRTPGSDEAQLSTRPIERWNHLIGGEIDRAWDYLSPGYRSTRNRVGYIEAMSNRPVEWIAADYHSHSCDENGRFCTVNLKVTFKVRSRQTGVGDVEAFSYLSERWVKSGDIWYHVPEEVSG
jgi:hypothetical protein